MAIEHDFFSPSGSPAARDLVLKWSGQEGPDSESAKRRRDSSSPVPGWMKKDQRAKRADQRLMRKKALEIKRRKKRPTLAELLKSREETPFQREKRRVIQREKSPAARRRMKKQQDRAFSP